jgi:signal transduction histidine kinase
LRLEDDVLRIQAACGLEADQVAQISVPVGTAAAGRALARRRPVIVPDLQGEPQREEIPPEPYWTPLQQLVQDYCAVLSVPLIVKDKAYGAISLYYRACHAFSDEEVRLAMSVADQVALAIENARLREQAGQAAAMEERDRLARELHDSVTQSLYSVTMYTEAAARLVSAGQEKSATEYLRDARDTAQEALREMRLLIYQLRPPVLEKDDLAVALQVRLDAVERRGGVQADLIVEGEDRLPAPLQAELYAVAQEALNNALKHARASRVQVHLHFGDATVSLEIRDDGVGFEPGPMARGGGLGLPGMQERVQRMGGRLNITSAPGQGTAVLIEVPTGGGG